MGLVGLLVGVTGTVAVDRVLGIDERSRMADLLRRVAEQERVIEAARGELAAIKREVSSWQEIRAAIWAPLGPSRPGVRPTRGVGGGVAPMEAGRPAAGLASDVRELASVVTAEGEGLRTLRHMMTRLGKVLGSLPTRWPVRGPVNSPFGPRRAPGSSEREFHKGIDIGARRGASVVAPAGGVVVHRASDPEYGNTVLIDHGGEIKSRYGHLHRIFVSAGQRVERGQQIGLAGNTGRSTGPHLHYEILVRGHPVDPRLYLWD